MGKTTSVIEINGNRYDAATGQIIGAIKSVNKLRNQVIDGFVNRPALRLAAASPANYSQALSASAGAPNLPRRAQKAQTLRRDGLKKPAGQARPRLSHSLSAPRPQTAARAQQILKHTKVNHFGIPRVAKGSKPAAEVHHVSGEIINRKTSKQTDNAASVGAPLPSMITSASHQKLERLLDAALFQADAHKQALKYQAARHFWQRPGLFSRRRLLAVAVIIIAALVLGGLAAWQRVPQLSVKLAAKQAHVGASLPGYSPPGYHLAKPATATANSVILDYQSSTGQSGYTLTQQRTGMTSASLARTIIPPSAPVQTSDVAGNTVYIYGQGNNAAWVNNGVLYTIKDQANLSADELNKVAQSLL